MMAKPTGGPSGTGKGEFDGMVLRLAAADSSKVDSAAMNLGNWWH